MKQRPSEQSRRLVVAALEHASVQGIHDHPGREAFLAGLGDISLKELAFDSLAQMEFCIYTELEAGIEVTPDRLQEARTLVGLARLLG
jgi:hypothetical protein